jgi:hypothetical protein
MNELEKCPYCGDLTEIKTEIVEYKFEYGDEVLVKDPSILTAIIPVETCKLCGCSWYGEVGGMLIDYAVKKHLESLKG